MGVMSCSRKDCENIMCDDYIRDIGYICRDCQNEFHNFIECDVLPKNEMIMKLKEFMATEKDSTCRDLVTLRDLFS